MLLTESHVDLPTPGGATMRLFLFMPTIPHYPQARFPAVILFSEIYQVTGPVARFAKQIAGQGYIVAAPSSYHPFIGPEPLAYDGPGTDLGNELKVKTPLRSYDEDVEVAVEYLKGLRICTGRIGATGMCLGGHLAFRAGMHPEVKVAVCYFPTDIHQSSLGTFPAEVSARKDIKDYPSIERLKDLKGKEVHLFFGKLDNHVPPAGRQTIRDALDKEGIVYGMYEFPWAQHAFIRDESSKGRYDPATTKVCWGILTEAFERILKLDLGERDGAENEIEDVC